MVFVRQPFHPLVDGKVERDHYQCPYGDCGHVGLRREAMMYLDGGSIACERCGGTFHKCWGGYSCPRIPWECREIRARKQVKMIEETIVPLLGLLAVAVILALYFFFY